MDQPTLAEQLKAIRAQSLNCHLSTSQLIDLVEAQAKEIERLQKQLLEPVQCYEP